MLEDYLPFADATASEGTLDPFKSTLSPTC